MKTKIKLGLFFLISFISLIWYAQLDAAWYGDHWYHNSWAGGWCDQDSQADATGPSAEVGGPAYGDSPWLFALYYIQGRVTTSYGGGWMNCQYWDSTPPTIPAISITNTTSNGWGNDAINLYMSASDYGGSNMAAYRIYVSTSTNSPGFTTWDSPTYWTTIAGGVNAVATYTSLVTDTAYRFYVVAIDGAGNETATPTSASIPSGVYKFDNTPPVISGISNNTNANLIANTNQVFSIAGGSDCGSPYVITATFGGAPVTATPSSTCPYAYTFTRDIRDVDSGRGANGGRQWDYDITQVCDVAGNCTNAGLPKTFQYFAFADALNGISSADGTAVTNGTSIADGQPRNFVHTIKDEYNNAIIPAPGINRTVAMNLSSISNTMFLNQYDRSGGSSVFLDNNTVALSMNSPQSLGSRSSTDGSYSLPLFVYTPTANSYVSSDPVSDPAASFGFTTNLIVNDDLIGLSTNKTFSQTLSNPVFKPLYTSVISGDLKNGGFIEGTEQSGSINISTNNTSIVPSSSSLQLEFSGANASDFTFDANSISIGNTRTDFQIPLSSVDPFLSHLNQKSNTLVADRSSLQLSTHFLYLLDGKNILYNSDIIGKTGGYWGAAQSIASQVGIKIIGPIASNAIQAIVNGQFADGTSIFGGFSRADIRNKMRQSIALATRNMILTPVSSSIDSLTIPNTSAADAKGTKIDLSPTNSIYKIERTTGDNVTLTLASGISGKRTLVVKGANLYINKDMYYADSNSILGVVVQKDDAGNGGNLYIDPSITNIVGTYILDGSVMSYDGTHEIGAGDITTLKNQLYIYGSIVSENTIGGSRMDPLRCPSLLNIACTTSTMAQKYDLNYLRRYYLFGGQPFGNGKIIGNETCDTATCTSTSTLPQKFTTPTEDLARYPVIIEYNPLIRTSPPIGFELSRE